jgi:hypothetical protein
MLKILVEYNRHTSSAKLTYMSCPVLPALLLGVSAGICQRALVDELGMIRTQKGTFVCYHPITVTSTSEVRGTW